ATLSPSTPFCATSLKITNVSPKPALPSRTRQQAVLLIFALILATARPAQGEPRRIVSTGPAITELLYALGLGARVVGGTRFCHYPPEAQSKPKIGDWINPNLEVIASLHPDLGVVKKNHT